MKTDFGQYEKRHPRVTADNVSVLVAEITF